MKHNGEKVLVVDDIPSNIEIIAEILQPMYKIKIALNGEKALKIATSQNPPDIILLDIMMPGIDGFEVCKRLKADKRTKNIPVIFITAKNESCDEEKGLALGAVDFLSKPVNPGIVKARVKNHLNLSRATKMLEKQNEILQENLALNEEVERINKHDLKGPLTVMMSIPEFFVNATNITEGQRKVISILERTSYKMLTMINRSLDLAKMERGIYKLEPKSVNIVRIINQIFSQLQPLIKMNKLKTKIFINKNIAPENSEFTLVGEESLFYCMLLNLIKNAIEASPEGEEILVYISNIDNWQVRVINNGSIPEPIRKRFFEKYVTVGKKGGTGLGTYSAELMAKTLRGTLNVSYTQNKVELIFEMPKSAAATEICEVLETS